MFGKKENTRELQEKLVAAQSQAEALQTVISQIEGQVQQVLPYFESQIIAQSQMDKELTDVVSHVYDTVAANSENVGFLEQFAIELTGMRGQLEEEEQEKKKQQDMLRENKGQLEEIRQGNERCAAPVERLQEAQQSLLGGVIDVQEQLRRMVELSKDMSVLCLNSAIEAGRMGESGRQFISAAEGVRQLAVSYEQAAEAARQQLGGIEGRLRLLEGQAAELDKMLKDDHASITRLEKSYEVLEDTGKGTSKQEFSKKAAALADNLKKISQNNDKIDALQHQTLDEIGRIGESFMDEQEARKELENIFDQVTAACIHT